MRALIVAIVAVLLTASVAEAQVQDLGHRIPSGIGLDAGTQVDQGLYFGDRLLWFASTEVHDRNGHTVPIQGFDLDAVANVLGIAGTLKVGELYLNAAIAVPMVKLSVSADEPRASIDRLGLGDVFIGPLKLGGRFSHFDAVGSYSFDIPSSQGQRTGVGRPQWSHQFAAGGTVFFEEDRRGWRFSALATYVHNGKKRGIDITRGDGFQLQGGVGGHAWNGFELGLAGYAVWQVTNDTGSELPMVLRGALERAFGVGPEVDLTVPSIRTRFVVRFMWDVDGKARPVGTSLVLEASFVAWQ